MPRHNHIRVTLTEFHQFSLRQPPRDVPRDAYSISARGLPGHSSALVRQAVDAGFQAAPIGVSLPSQLFDPPLRPHPWTCQHQGPSP